MAGVGVQKIFRYFLSRSFFCSELTQMAGHIRAGYRCGVPARRAPVGAAQGSRCFKPARGRPTSGHATIAGLLVGPWCARLPGARCGGAREKVLQTRPGASDKRTCHDCRAAGGAVACPLAGRLLGQRKEAGASTRFSAYRLGFDGLELAVDPHLDRAGFDGADAVMGDLAVLPDEIHLMATAGAHAPYVA